MHWWELRQEVTNPPSIICNSSPMNSRLKVETRLKYDKLPCGLWENLRCLVTRPPLKQSDCLVWMQMLMFEKRQLKRLLCLLQLATPALWYLQLAQMDGTHLCPIS